jgi:hypothetical protein
MTTTAQPGKPAQLTEADVKRLYRERRYGEIEQARQAGRLDDLLAGRNQPTDAGPTAA